MMDTIKIKPLRDWQEMQAAVEIQRTCLDNVSAGLIPAHMLFSLANYGGHILAAYDGPRMIGILIGFLGTDVDENNRPAMANLLIHSKFLVVLPEYRKQGVAYQLKLAQRDFAVRQGVRLVTWSFDPLLSHHAYLGIRKLGVVCPRFEGNRYAAQDHQDSPDTSDRLIADWWVTHRRVKERINGRRGDLSLSQYLEAHIPILNPSDINDSGDPVPAIQLNKLSGSLALLEIPVGFDHLMTKDRALALAWRTHVQTVFKELFTSGHIVTDFLYEQFEGRDRAFYVLSRNLGHDFSLN